MAVHVAQDEGTMDTPETSFETLKTNTLEAIQSYFPHEGRRRRLVVENLRVDDHLSAHDIKSQAEVKDKEGTWGVPIKATLKLVDKVTGKVIDEKKDATLARLPKLTNRYGFIVNGSEYQVDHLFRLKSGVYARIQNNGDLESEFNLAKSPTGRNFSIKLDRKSKKFSMRYVSANIPLYPILKTMGVSDDELEAKWGKEIFAANRISPDDAKFNKAITDFAKRASESDHAIDPAHAPAHIHSFFDQTKLLPETTKITLGKSFDKVTGEALSLAAHKILAVSRNPRAADDRDSLTFKHIVSVEDFIPEKISRNARAIKGRLRNTIDHKDKVTDILSTDLFNRPIHEFFTKGGSVTERSDQTNPIQMLSAHRKTTLMAKDAGGIKGDNQLTDEMRAVNPSHLGFLDPMHTPESSRTGITLHLSANVRKNDKDLETPVFNLKTGKHEYVKVPEFHTATAVLPDQVTWVSGKPLPRGDKVKVKLPGGDVELRSFKDADYVMPSAKGMFDHASNLIPFLPCNQGNRVSMADKQMEQAISLKHREAPLVQSKSDHQDHSFEKVLGQFTATTSHVDGKVLSVKPDAVVVHGTDGKKHEIQVYNHFPLNDPKGMMHSEPVVSVGDTVKKGQIIADSNFTKKGVLATGTNLRVGYMPYKGYNYEDGIVISESAASKLTSEHLYKKDLEVDPSTDHVSKSKLHAHSITRASRMKKEHWDALDDNGVIKVGTQVMPGQVLVAAVGKNLDARRTSIVQQQMGKRAFQEYRDKSLTWDEDHVGTVTKVVRAPGGRGFKVYVKTEEAAVIGDKLAGRHGNKGIITQILPDHEMPFVQHGDEKKHLEILLNPSGIPTRINPGQMLETAAGKVAEKTGKPYVVDNFAGSSHDYRAQVIGDLKKHGLDDEELVFDPKDPKRPLGKVLVGPQYVLKLKHQVEKKLTVRGGGTDINGRPLPYDNDRQPQKGGERGGQGFGALDVYALLGHDARHNLREMATYKSDQQDGVFWAMVQSGHEPPPPKAPFAYEKFTSLLKGLGVNVTKEGTGVRLSPMTSKEVLKLAGNGKNEITKGHLTLKAKNLKEEAGGLFDPHATGGVEGDKWAFIRLAEPVPNPIFVGQHNMPGPVPVLLGLSMKGLEEVMSGAKDIEGRRGGLAIQHALKKIDVDKEIQALRTELPTLRTTSLDRANKKLKYLLALKESNLTPDEAYMLHHVPVIPPKFRPVTSTPRGDLNVTPINGLYKNLSLINDQLTKFDAKTFSEEHRKPLRAQLWDSMKALQSVGNYKSVYDVDSSGNRELTGILGTIATGGGEGQPKDGFFQSKLVKRKQNLSIRSTIVPEPNLGIDQVGLPRNAAMELYKPFVVAQLGRWGHDPLTAQQRIREGNDIAFRALEKVVTERPILLKRDPVLHKYSVMAFQPVLVDGKAIQIHPLVTGGFNADFDGDTMAGTVPLSREAVEEAKKMFPSKNLFSPTTGGVMYAPSQEALLGLHLLSKWGKQTNKTFDSVLALEKAVDQGQLHVTDVVHVKGFKAPTTLGRLKLSARLPKSFAPATKLLHDQNYEIDKGTLNKEIVPGLAKQHTDKFAQVVDDLKNLGNEYSFKFGFSFGLKDLAPVAARDGILGKAHSEVSKLKSHVHDKDELDKRTIAVYQKATEDIDAAAKAQLTKDGNRLGVMVYSGARGKPDALRQMIAAPMLMQDSSNRTIPVPVTKSYAEGLDVGDYWLAQHGARKGTLQRAMGTSEPGAISKDIINTTMSTLVVSPDCGTNQGVLMRIGGHGKKADKDVFDRYTAATYKLKDGKTIKEGTLVTPELVSRLVNNKEDKILVRSPLKCSHGEGVCAKCFGLNENGKLHATGTNIGVLAGQALGEPAVQMAMDAFHSGGVASSTRGAKSVDRFTRLENLLKMPEKLRDEATIAMASGKITDIKRDPTGGVDVYIGGIKHLVPKHLVDENIRVGHEVKKGDKLSDGYINPHGLLAATKDIHAVQHYLTNEMYEGLYEKEGVRRRNVEVAVRTVTNLTRIKDPGHSDWLHGDIVPRSVVEEHNRNLPKGEKPVHHEPILKGVREIPSLASTNWMARLNYQKLHTTVQQAAAQGWTSDLHGNHPIPGLAHGAEFGKPPSSKPPHSY